MAKLIQSSTHKIGLAPGSVVYVGNKQSTKKTIDVIDYTETVLDEKVLQSAEACHPYQDKASVTWFDIDSVDDTGLIQEIGEEFGIHELVLEDIVNTGQRPKMEDHGKYIFITMKMLYRDPEDDALDSEQVSLLIGNNYVFTFQEQEHHIFDAVKERLRMSTLRIRKMGSDYLGYALVDTVVDYYFMVLEQMNERLEALEEELVTQPAAETLSKLHQAKRELIILRKAVWPLREMVSDLLRSESKLFSPKMRYFVGDLYDHTLQVLDTLETFRDVVGGLQDVYLSNVSNKMNETMKTLTIIATIFIPLTFLAGIYGMNFEHMPELGWKHGYRVFWLIMVIMMTCMLVIFRRKKWL